MDDDYDIRSEDESVCFIIPSLSYVKDFEFVEFVAIYMVLYDSHSN